MQCPRCRGLLAEMRRAGILVDACPGCGGVWLDRGELARIAGRLWELENDWDTTDGGAQTRIPWGSRFRYPRRHPKRRLGPIPYLR
jgi:Zn-finger nucleic acid-binding protein